MGLGFTYERNKNNSRQKCVHSAPGGPISLRHFHMQHYCILHHCQTSANIAVDVARPWFHQFRADAAECWNFLITACQSDSEQHIAGRLITRERCRGKSSNISLEFTNIPTNKLPHATTHMHTHTPTHFCGHNCTHNYRLIKHTFTQMTACVLKVIIKQ